MREVDAQGSRELPIEQDECDMIRLTRLNNRPLVVNSELIKFIENAPDTVITLVTGEKIVVRETVETVLSMIVEYRRRLLGHLPAAPPSENEAEKLAPFEERPEDVEQGD
jgi:flagellar protein FlbD